ncbi:MAG: molybdopterin-dependent oxidoreductase [Ferruginibacter sp.]|nr:molybdopterin-dependent oxidoreductase [Ferruginibacter sp.]
MNNPFNKKTTEKIVYQKQINRRNFIAFTSFIGLNVVAFESWRWLYKSPEEKSGITAGARKPLRKALNQNELILRKTFSDGHLVKTYPKSMADPNVRVNSEIGIDDPDYDSKTWSLIINKKDGSQLQLSLKDIMALPKTEIVYDFKCVEGWDQISYWGGLKFKDFINHFNLQEEAKLQYVGMATPDKAYYVGIDMPSALHPQTLLAYEVNGKLLPMNHGHPLRLIIPVKYGIKNLKRIGTISFSDERLPDYWAEQGYDYYSGL